MLKKSVIVLLLLSSLMIEASAQQDCQREKVVTNKWSFLNGEGTFANHYMTNQEYNGWTIGIKAEHGAFYKRSENLSWDYDLSFYTSPYFKVMPDFALANPAKTTYISHFGLNTAYGTHYHWNIGEHLSIKAGGFFDVLAGLNLGKPDSINNGMTVDLQTQLEASAGLRYNVEWWKLNVAFFWNIATPVMGFMLVDSKYQDFFKNENILPGNLNHFVFSSFHNMQGYDTEFGVDIIFKHLTLSISDDSQRRWWHAYGLQNYRLFSFAKIGVSVDLVSRSRKTSSNRYF